MCSVKAFTSLAWISTQAGVIHRSKSVAIDVVFCGPLPQQEVWVCPGSGQTGQLPPEEAGVDESGGPMTLFFCLQKLLYSKWSERNICGDLQVTWGRYPPLALNDRQVFSNVVTECKWKISVHRNYIYEHTQFRKTCCRRNKILDHTWCRNSKTCGHYSTWFAANNDYL